MFWDIIFKRKIKNSALVNPNIFVDIIDYSDLDENSKAIVNRYKEEYQELFKSIYSTKDLDKYIIEEILLYQDLILNVLCKDTFGELLESRLSSVKLNLYSKKYKEISEILKLKYIALLELKKDKKYVSLHNRLYLKAKYKINVIDIINYHESTLYNLIATINDRIFKCISVCSLNNPKIDLYKEELENRYNEVNYDYKTIFNKAITILESIVDSIAYAEIELEKYAINNKDKLTQYQNRLIEISNMEIKDLNERDKIIEELMNININYSIYKKYGRNIISQKELEELYQIIFNVYTYFPYDNDFKGYYINLKDKKEKEYYNKIIEFKLELLKSEQAASFSEQYNNKVMGLLINELTADMNNSLEDVIINKLDFILSLDYKNGLKIYFEKQRNKTVYIKSLNCYMKILEYYKLLLAVNKYRNMIYSLKGIDSNNTYFEIRKELFDNYRKYFNIIKIYDEMYKINFNEFPKGIPDNYFNHILSDYYYDFSKPLIVPSNLEEIDIYCISNNKIIMLNNGVKVNIIVDNRINREYDYTKIIIPKNLASINILYKSDDKMIPCKLIDMNSIQKNDIINIDKLGNIFAKLSNIFIFKEEIFSYSLIELKEYLYYFFQPFKNLICDAYNYKYLSQNQAQVEKIKLLFFHLLDNISVIDDDGNIKKFKLSDAINDSKGNIIINYSIDYFYHMYNIRTNYSLEYYYFKYIEILAEYIVKKISNKNYEKGKMEEYLKGDNSLMSLLTANRIINRTRANNLYRIDNNILPVRIDTKRLNKLIFLCYMLYLIKYNEELFIDSFSTWSNGPVIRSLYDIFSIADGDLIPKYQDKLKNNSIIFLSEEQKNFINSVVDSTIDIPTNNIIDFYQIIYDKFKDTYGFTIDSKCLIPKKMLKEFVLNNKDMILNFIKTSKIADNTSNKKLTK